MSASWYWKLVVAALVAAASFLGCDEEKKVDASQLYGAWFPCNEQGCETFGESGIAFMKDRWFYRGSYQEPSEPGGKPSFSFDDRECCWGYDGSEVILDLGDSYQALVPRFDADDILQLESLSYWILDRDVQGWHEHECNEDEVFEEVDGGEEEEEDSDAWTPEVCWTENWAPLGRAARLLDENTVYLLTFDPEEHIDTF